jgi:hypothetical protein
MENFTKTKALKRTNKTENNKKLLNGLKDILRVFEVLDNSFGLFLIYKICLSESYLYGVFQEGN